MGRRCACDVTCFTARCTITYTTATSGVMCFYTFLESYCKPCNTSRNLRDQNFPPLLIKCLLLHICSIHCLWIPESFCPHFYVSIFTCLQLSLALRSVSVIYEANHDCRDWTTSLLQPMIDTRYRDSININSESMV